MTYNDHIAASLRAELAYRRVSARELARRVGMSQSSMATRLSGEVEFRTGELERIAAALGVATDRLLTPERAA